MDNNHETEEQMKERLRKEILEELKQEDKKESVDTNVVQSFAPPKKNTVQFHTNVAPEEEKKVEEKAPDKPKTNGKTKRTSLVFLIICGIIAIGAVALFPTISKMIREYRNSKIKPDTGEVQKDDEEPTYPTLTLQSEDVINLKYPITHSNITNKTTFYAKDKITISDFSNNDILVNAFVDMTNGVNKGFFTNYTGRYNGTYCGSNDTKFALDESLIISRIENMYTKNVKYTLSDFVVPATIKNVKYPGTWKYDKTRKQFIYYGNCSKTPTSNMEYYDLRVPYEVSTSEKNIEIYVNNYIAFALVDNRSGAYIIYKDSNYTEELTRGTLTTKDYETELTNILKNYEKKDILTYKFTFTMENCAFLDHCFISGERIQ